MHDSGVMHIYHNAKACVEADMIFGRDYMDKDNEPELPRTQEVTAPTVGTVQRTMPTFDDDQSISFIGNGKRHPCSVVRAGARPKRD